MRLGCCAGLASFVPPTVDATQLDTSAIYQAKVEKVADVVRLMEEAGCEFMEFGVGMLAPEQPESDFEKFRAALGDTKLVPECYNSFLPADLKVTGPSVDLERAQRYVETAAVRAKSLGGEIIVFGSGGARNYPDGTSAETARAQLIEFLHVAGDAVKAHGIQIAMEPLNHAETNLINRVDEALALAKETDHEAIKVLADFYHFNVEKEPFENLVDAADHLIHVHVADTNRLYPGSGDFDYAGLFHTLEQIGYQGRVSIECNFRDFSAEMPKGMAFLQTFVS